MVKLLVVVSLFVDVEKTLKLVDEVLGYYNVSKEVENVIRNGPSSGSLDEYLNAIASIEQAVKYFEKNNSQSVELENLVIILYYFICMFTYYFRVHFTKSHSITTQPIFHMNIFTSI